MESEQGFLCLVGTPKEQGPGPTPMHSDALFPVKTIGQLYFLGTVQDHCQGSVP